MKTYEIDCRLHPEAAMERIKNLLAKEGVRFRTADRSRFSIKTPIAVLGAGLNPFTYVSAVNVQCQTAEGDVTSIIVDIDQFRAFVWVMFWIVCLGLAASGLPKPAGAGLFVGGCLLAWFGNVSFLGGYLIKKEIADCLNARPSEARVSGAKEHQVEGPCG